MYQAKVLEKIETKPGCWNYLKIGVFNTKTQEQVGEYQRNYSAFYNTFYPFKHEEKWYALYSHDYTATAIMSLPDCKLVTEEPRNAYGFCPVDYYVPRYTKTLCPAITGEELLKYPEQNRHWISKDRTDRFYDTGNDKMGEIPYEEWAEIGDLSNKSFQFLPGLYYDLKMGFVAGCVWGDDSSWKVQRLDLSNFLTEGIKRIDSFGYAELALGQSLKEAIRISDDNNDERGYLHINLMKCFQYKNEEFKEVND